MTRAEAIKILNKYDLNFCDIDGNPIPPQDLAEAFDMAIEALEQEQSEIIRCKNCRHDNNCEIQYSAQAGSKFFCSFAERKEQ